MRAQLVVLSLITASAMVVRNGKQAGPHMSVEEIIKMIQAHPNIMTTNHHPKNVPANISVKGADYTAAEKAIYDDMADTKKNSDGKCLRFMHIPNNGGSRIQSINMKKAKGQRPFHSLMELVFDRVAEAEAKKATSGAKAKSAGQIFDESHANMETYYHSFMWEHYHEYLWRVMPEGAGACTAPHAPPVEDEVIQSYYNDTSCTTFCVIRDPMERFVSTFKAAFNDLKKIEGFGLTNSSECSLKNFEKWADKFLGHSGAVGITGQYGLTSAVDCHFAPQVLMVYGTRNSVEAPYCDRILNASRLEEDFNGLMEEYGRDERLGSSSLQFRSKQDACDFTAKDVSFELKRKHSEVYMHDYLKFNFTRTGQLYNGY